jgi:16S rRNA (adenine1518-N6/adenine1519-N6)-dimethyltransferase
MKRHRLGQHYLADPAVVQMMMEVAAVRPDERILEIGTGRGALTKELVKAGKSFEGYELDEENYRATRAVVRGSATSIHLGDAFRHRPTFDVLVASLPYSESAGFVKWLSAIEYDRAVVLLQEDFVRKILAPPGSRDYRAISALAQISSEVKVAGRVPRAAFSPPPRVNSVVALFVPRSRIREGEASRIMRLFSLRRKQVVSALKELGIARRHDYGTRRVYSLTPREVHALCSPTVSA